MSDLDVEKDVLRRFLEQQRKHVTGILDGLSDEHYWFRCIMAGQHSNAIIDATPLGAPPRLQDPWWGQWAANVTDLRYVMLHVIAETACHAGHLDAAAELIDGRQWVVL